MVVDTNSISAIEKSCSRCGETKEFDKFIKKRNICKDCDNTRKKDKYKSIVMDDSVV